MFPRTLATPLQRVGMRVGVLPVGEPAPVVVGPALPARPNLTRHPSIDNLAFRVAPTTVLLR